MNQEVYNVVSEYDPTVYEFLSDGPKGLIRKVIYYQEIRKDIFNLSFGDWEADWEPVEAGKNYIQFTLEIKL